MVSDGTITSFFRGEQMDLKMIFEKKRQSHKPLEPLDSIVIELRGTPVLVENLKDLIVEYMQKQEDFNAHY